MIPYGLFPVLYTDCVRYFVVHTDASVTLRGSRSLAYPSSCNTFRLGDELQGVLVTTLESTNVELHHMRILRVHGSFFSGAHQVSKSSALGVNLNSSFMFSASSTMSCYSSTIRKRFAWRHACNHARATSCREEGWIRSVSFPNKKQNANVNIEENRSMLRKLYFRNVIWEKGKFQFSFDKRDRKKMYKIEN